MVHASAGGNRGRHTAPATVVGARIIPWTPTVGMWTHGRAHVPSVRTAVPKGVYGKSEGLGPVGIVRKEVALLSKVVWMTLLLGRRRIAVMLCMIGVLGIIKGITAECTVL